jgi:hypothetical protein
MGRGDAQRRRLRRGHDRHVEFAGDVAFVSSLLDLAHPPDTTQRNRLARASHLPSVGALPAFDQAKQPKLSLWCRLSLSSSGSRGRRPSSRRTRPGLRPALMCPAASSSLLRCSSRLPVVGEPACRPGLVQRSL